MIEDPGHFRESAKFAKQLPVESRKTFIRCLKTLNRLKKSYDGELMLYPDFCAHSFCFSINSKDTSMSRFGKIYLNGGMILHGFGQTYSVELSAPTYPHWSIHT